MEKIAIIIDSFSGRDEEWTKKHPHFYYLPLQLELDDTNYKIGMDNTVTYEGFVKKIGNAKKIKTSMPTPQDMINLFGRLSKKYEYVIYLSIGSAVSGTAKAAMVFAREFDNVHVLDNYLVGKSFEILGKKLIDMGQNNESFTKIMEFAKTQVTEKLQTFVVPKDVTPFIKSGRLGKALGLLLQKVNAVPVVGYENTEKLQKKMIKRSWKKAINYVIEKIIIKSHELGAKYIILVTHGPDQEVTNFTLNLLKKAKQKYIAEKASVLALSATGIGGISIGVIRK